MNLHEYFLKVLDNLEDRYRKLAYADNPELQRYALYRCPDSNDHYIVGEAIQRLEEIKAFREIAERHKTHGSFSTACLGCALTSYEEYVTPDINDCHTLRPLAKALTRDRDDIPEYLK